MSAMFRRLLRIFCVVGLILLCGTAVVGQFWWIGLSSPPGGLSLGSNGLVFRLAPGKWSADYDRIPEWSWKNLVEWPGNVGPTYDEFTVIEPFFPWWLILLTWSLFAALIWRLARPKYNGRGFPIEPPAKPE
jgi:hypothetical protein